MGKRVDSEPVKSDMIAAIEKIVGNSKCAGSACLSDAAESEDRKKRNNSYEVSYEVIRRWCDAQKSWSADTCILLAQIVYGWMPDILTLDSGKKPEKLTAKLVREDAEFIANLLNDGSFKCPMTAEEHLGRLKRFINNSLVGASKFLHFIYPNEYAMWDSNVAEALSRDNKTLSTSAHYIFWAYQHAMRAIVSEKDKMRDVEWLVFRCGQARKDAKKKAAEAK